MYLRVISLFCFLCALLSCKQESGHGPHDGHNQKHVVELTDLNEYRDSATVNMAKELVACYLATPTQQTIYKNAVRSDLFAQQATITQDAAQKYVLELRSYYESLLAGENEKALAGFTVAYNQIQGTKLSNKKEIIYKVLEHLAVTNFRIGEIENCRTNHNEASCLLPFSDESYHKLERGSRQAIANILELLAIKPNPNYIWLLNMAYMTLGEYPESVPKNYLVPLLPEEKPMTINKFRNIGSGIGIDDNQLSGGVVIDDFTGNGFLDVFSSSWHLKDQVAFYKNNGDGTFTEQHLAAGLKGITGGLNMTHGDYNNDGHLDLLILRGAWLKHGQHPNSLLKNNGDGTFSDVTHESRLYSLHPSQTATWADFNNDGWIDIFIGNESFNGQQASPCELYFNLKNGQFKNIAAEVGADKVGVVKGVASADIDNDGDQDLYISRIGKDNYLLRNEVSDNQYGFSFEDMSKSSNVEKPIFSFPTWFFDYNNDGLEDLYVSTYSSNYYNNVPAEYLKELMNQPFESETPKLYKNKGNGQFQDVTEEVGLAKVLFSMGSGFGDLNNDGYLDFYIGTGEPDLKAVIPNRAFLNEGGKRFQEVTTQAGLGHVQKGHAISFADLDNDGDEDVYAVLGGAFEGDNFYNAMFQNPGHGNNFVKVKLKGKASNSFGYGSRLCLTVESSTSSRKIYRTVGSGSSFGENPTMVHFGYLASENPVDLKVTWPSGAIQNFDQIGNGNVYFVIEDQKEMTTIIQKKINFKLGNGVHHHH